MRDPVERDEIKYGNQIAIQTAKEEAAIQQANYFIKYELTPQFIADDMMDYPDKYAAIIFPLLLGGDDKFVGAQIRTALWRVKYEELMEE